MADFFTITFIMNERQKVAYVRLCTKGKALEWWKANRYRYHTWVGVKEALKTYYGNYYQADQACSEIVGLKHISMVQRHLHDID